MPIYAYRCTACGHAKDVLQKLSDAPLSLCPSCGAAAFTKQVTAAGFQLKGSGWYVTDFRGGNQAAPKAEGGQAGAAGDGAKASDKPADKPADQAAAKGSDKPAAKPADKSATPAASDAKPSKPAAAPPAGSGS